MNGDVSALLSTGVRPTAIEAAMRTRQQAGISAANGLSEFVEWPVDEKLWWRVGGALLPQIRV